MKKFEHVWAASTRLVLVVCDICGKAGEDGYWDRSEYRVQEVEIVARVGRRSPQDTEVTVTEFDICPECFANVVIPALRDLGAKPTVTQESW
jgi:hypothetical protein